MKIVSILLSLLIFSEIAAESKLQSLTKAQCETDFGGNTYFDDNRKNCILKLGFIEDEQIAKQLPNGRINPPRNSKIEPSFDPATFDFKSLTIGCQPHYTPSPDRKYCNPSRKFKETCIIFNNEEYVNSVNSSPTDKNSTSNCDSDSGLVCNPNNELCECEEGEFNSELQFCISSEWCQRYDYGYDPVNNICVYHLDSKYDYFAHKYFPCPHNSELAKSTGDSFSCNCVSGFEKSEDGKSCLASIPLNGNCSRSNDSCTKTQGLQCGENGICNCRENSIWHPHEQKCRIPAYRACETRCGEAEVSTGDSYCEQNPHLTCGKNSKCEASKYYRSCSCDTKYAAVNGFCYGQEFGKCQAKNDCENELDCIDGFCRCPELLSQKYTSSSQGKKCRLFPGSHCQFEAKITEHSWSDYIINKMRNEVDESKNPCISGAICLDGQCVCRNGTSMTADRECLVSFGNSCIHLNCNFDEGLSCQNGICSCIDSGLGYVEGEGCLAKIGFPCGYDVGSKCSASENCESLPKYNVKCQGPATCQTIKDGISYCK